MPLLKLALLVAVEALLVTKVGAEENTEGQRSEETLLSGTQVLLRGSERQLLNRGRGGFGVLPESQPILKVRAIRSKDGRGSF